MVGRATCAAHVIAMWIGVVRAARAPLLMVLRNGRAPRRARHAAHRRRHDGTPCAPVVFDIDIDVARPSREGRCRTLRAVTRTILAEEKNDEREASARDVLARPIETVSNVFREA